jgi:hypothetical protein
MTLTEVVVSAAILGISTQVGLQGLDPVPPKPPHRLR